ncbi:hypothetical protein FACS189421_13420 [Bacteroidia bacterium]|nr:hypothetical protein FACS189421_13420 [Bacteroidia bacterium]
MPMPTNIHIIRYNMEKPSPITEVTNPPVFTSGRLDLLLTRPTIASVWAIIGNQHNTIDNIPQTSDVEVPVGCFVAAGRERAAEIGFLTGCFGIFSSFSYHKQNRRTSARGKIMLQITKF